MKSALLTLFTALSLAQLLAQEPDLQEGCMGPLAPPATIGLHWLDLPDENALASITGTTIVPLEILNLTREPLTVDLKAVMSAGGQLPEMDLGTFSVPAADSTVVPITLEDFGVLLWRLRYSGALKIVGEPQTQAGVNRRRAYAPTLFFHGDQRDQDTLLAYGQKVYLTDFNGGDFQGLSGTAAGQAVLAHLYLGAGLVELPGPTWEDGQWNFCFRWRFEAVDSGAGEDYYDDSDIMRAHGLKVEISHPNWNEPMLKYADPYSGCVFFEAEETEGFTVRVWPESRLGVNGNVTLRAFEHHNAPLEQIQLDVDPGLPYGQRSFTLGMQFPKLANMMAFSTHMFRFVDTQTHPRLTANATLNSYGDVYPSPLCTGGCSVGLNDIYFQSHRTNEKFGVGHEVGHWYHKNRYGGSNLNYSFTNDDYNADPNLEPNCVYTINDGPGRHAMRSKEYAAHAMSEGFAHYLAALAWNNHHYTNGYFRYYKNLDAMPVYDDMQADEYRIDLDAEGPDPLGGTINWMENMCFGEGGFGTEMDWLRFFWNFRSDYPGENGVPGPKPTHGELFRIIVGALQYHSWGGNPENAYNSLLQALDNPQLQVSHLKDRWLFLAQKHGVHWPNP